MKEKTQASDNAAKPKNKEANLHAGHRDRMRKKFLNGSISSLEPHEILETILYYSIPQGNTNPLAHRLIDAFGSLVNVFDADVEDLKNIEGIGERSAVLIKLISQLSDYCQRLRWSDKPVLYNFSDTGAYITDMIGQRTEEYFFLLSLDISGKVLSFNEIERGTVNGSNVNIRKVLECAIRCHASDVVLAHNHPTGRLIPSSSDMEITRLLNIAFDAVGINLKDHFIVGNGGFISMSEEGYIK